MAVIDKLCEAFERKVGKPVQVEIGLASPECGDKGTYLYFQSVNGDPSIADLRQFAAEHQRVLRVLADPVGDIDALLKDEMNRALAHTGCKEFRAHWCDANTFEPVIRVKIKPKTGKTWQIASIRLDPEC